jgi:hypothetical protein
MPKKTFRFETVVDLPPSLAKRVESVAEEDSLPTPRMERDVYGVASSYAAGAFIAAAAIYDDPADRFDDIHDI